MPSRPAPDLAVLAHTVTCPGAAPQSPQSPQSPDGAPLPECLSCGVCCFSTLTTYVRVTGDDHARLPWSEENGVHFEGNRAYMRMRDGHCAALRIDVIDAANGKFVCTSYEGRPQACRDLERGSAACRGEIATKGGRPGIELGRLATPPHIAK